MSKKMFPAGDSVDSEGTVHYTDPTMCRVADALEGILRLLERGHLPCLAGDAHLENGIPNGTSPAGANEAMTVNEAAKMLRISLPKMYDLVHDGRVHSITIGRKILVSRSSLMEFLTEGE